MKNTKLIILGLILLVVLWYVYRKNHMKNITANYGAFPPPPPRPHCMNVCVNNCMGEYDWETCCGN